MSRVFKGDPTSKQVQTKEVNIYQDLIKNIESETDVQKLRNMLIEHIDNQNYEDLFNNYYKNKHDEKIKKHKKGLR